MHDAEKDHDVAEVLRISPAVIVGQHGPSRFSQNLHHYVLGLDESAEGRELLVLVVAG